MYLSCPLHGKTTPSAKISSAITQEKWGTGEIQSCRNVLFLRSRVSLGDNKTVPYGC